MRAALVLLALLGTVVIAQEVFPPSGGVANLVESPVTSDDISFPLQGPDSSGGDATFGAEDDPTAGVHLYDGDTTIKSKTTSGPNYISASTNYDNHLFLIEVLKPIVSADVQFQFGRYGLKILTQGSRPTCSSTVRSNIWVVRSGAGVADTIEICAKNSSDTYAWYALATIP